MTHLLIVAALIATAAGPDIPRLRIVAYEPKPDDSISAHPDPAGEFCRWSDIVAAWPAGGGAAALGSWIPGTTPPPPNTRVLGQYMPGSWYKTYEYQVDGTWIAIDPSGYKRPGQIPPLYWAMITEPGTAPLTVESITPSHVGPTSADSLTFTVTFSADVTGFDSSDVVIVPTGVTFSGTTVTGGPRVYDVTVQGITGDGSFKLYIDTASDIRSATGPLTPGAMTVTAQMGHVKDVPVWLYHVVKGLMATVPWNTIMDAGDMVNLGIPPKGEPE